MACFEQEAEKRCISIPMCISTQAEKGETDG
jgi:hypothetical protein